jgi:hypothetical protein
MYLDEDYGGNGRYLVLTGIIVPVSVWGPLNKDIDKLKEDIFKNKMFNLKNVRKNRYDKEKVWLKLPKEKQDDFNKKFYKIINGHNISIISALIDKESMKDPKNRGLHFYLAYGFLIQRYEYYLNEKKMLGIVIMDRNKNKEVADLFFTQRKFLDEGIPIRKRKHVFKVGSQEIELEDYEKRKVHNIFENLLFMDDKYSNSLQIVDTVCAAISWKFNRNISTYYDKIESKIKRSKDGKILGFGLKFFPKPP